VNPRPPSSTEPPASNHGPVLAPEARQRRGGRGARPPRPPPLQDGHAASGPPDGQHGKTSDPPVAAGALKHKGAHLRRRLVLCRGRKALPSTPRPYTVSAARRPVVLSPRRDQNRKAGTTQRAFQSSASLSLSGTIVANTTQQLQGRDWAQPRPPSPTLLSSITAISALSYLSSRIVNVITLFLVRLGQLVWSPTPPTWTCFMPDRHLQTRGATRFSMGVNTQSNSQPNRSRIPKTSNRSLLLSPIFRPGGRTVAPPYIAAVSKADSGRKTPVDQSGEGLRAFRNHPAGSQSDI